MKDQSYTHRSVSILYTCSALAKTYLRFIPCLVCDRLRLLKSTSSIISSCWCLSTFMVCAAICLHKSHENETLIIKKMFQNHETNASLYVQC